MQHRQQLWGSVPRQQRQHWQGPQRLQGTALLHRVCSPAQQPCLQLQLRCVLLCGHAERVCCVIVAGRMRVCYVACQRRSIDKLRLL